MPVRVVADAGRRSKGKAVAGGGGLETGAKPEKNGTGVGTNLQYQLENIMSCTMSIIDEITKGML